MDPTFIALIGVVVTGAIVVGLRFPIGNKTGEEDLGQFKAKDLLDKNQRSILSVLDTHAPAVFGADARVFAQVAYAEFLGGESAAAQARISQKRADFAIANRKGKVLCIVEYHGPDHFGQAGADRENVEKQDKIKRAACTSAGIPLVEVPVQITPHEFRQRLIEAAAARAEKSKIMQDARGARCSRP